MYRSDEEYEDAYMVWAYQNNRNLTKTAQDTGIPLRTLQYRKRMDGWDSRYAAESGEVAGFAFEYGMNELRLGVSSAALQLVRDASNPDSLPSDRLASQKLLFAIIANTHTEDMKAPSHISLIDARSITIPPNNLQPGDLARMSMQANVQQSIESQTKRKGPARSA